VAARRYQAARFQHFALTVGYCAFFLIHVVQVIKAGWNNFRAMLTGFELVEYPAPAVSPGVESGTLESVSVNGVTASQRTVNDSKEARS
jgi:hypothetical protein